MSASRTIIRKFKTAIDKRLEPGNQRIKPGTPRRRVTNLDTDPRTGVAVPPDRELTYHATKGFREGRA